MVPKYLQTWGENFPKRKQSDADFVPNTSYDYYSDSN